MTKQRLIERIAVLEEALEQARQIIDEVLTNKPSEGGEEYEEESLQASH